MDRQNRLIWADSLKGCLMYLVIVGHIIQGMLFEECENNHLWNLIYSFHMPAFMAVSGWFVYKDHTQYGEGKKKFWNIIQRRCFQLLLPYILWRLINGFLSGSNFIDSCIAIVVSPETGYWFLWTLFWINILFVMAQFAAKKLMKDELIIILMLALVLMGIMVIFDIRVFAFQYIAYYFLFYMAGYILRRYNILSYLNGWHYIIVCILWFILAWSWNMHELPFWMPNIPYIPMSLVQYIYRGLTAILAVIFILGIAPKYLNTNNFFRRCTCYIGTYSLGFYVVQPLINLMILDLFTDYVKINFYIAVCVVSIISTILCYIAVSVLTYNRYTLKYLLGKN